MERERGWHGSGSDEGDRIKRQMGGGSQRQGEQPRVRKWVSCDFLESRGDKRVLSLIWGCLGVGR